MKTRREILRQSAAIAGALASLGLLPHAALAANAPDWNAAAFDAKTMDALMKALGGSAPTESADVKITGPDIAENGAVVPVGAATTLPGVKRVLLLVEKNPSMLSAMFEVNDAIEADFTTRIKMGQSSNVFAVAMTGDGKAYFASKEIKVTLGGCGG